MDKKWDRQLSLLHLHSNAMSFWPQFCAIVFLSVSCASYIFRHVVCKILKKEMDQTLHVCHAWSTHWLTLATCKDCVTEWTELYGWSPRNCHCLLVMYLGRERQGTQGVGRGHRDGRVYSSAQSQQSISTIVIKKENKEAVMWRWILITLLNPHYLAGEGTAAAALLHKLPHPSQELSTSGWVQGFVR